MLTVWQWLHQLGQPLRTLIRVLTLAVFLLPTRLEAQNQRAIVELVVNQLPQGEALIILRENDLLIRQSDLEESGLQTSVEHQELIEQVPYVSLASLTNTVRYQFDERTLVLNLTAQPEILGKTQVDLGSTPPPDIVYSRDTSAFFNYAISQQNLSSYAFSGELGVSFQGNLLYSSFSQLSGGSFQRQFTNLTVDDREGMTRWVFGDSFASTDGLGGSAFLGGISVARQFDLNPYFVRQPTFDLSGAVLTPSTVEAFVNGKRVRREELSPGQFKLNNLLLPSGSGTTQVVIRDAFGREQELTTPFYFSAELLKPGLSEFNFHLGWRRQRLQYSWEYDTPIFLAHYRQGVSPWLTAGGRLEVTPDMASSGATVTAAFPIGSLDVSAAASSEAGADGSAASLTYSYSGRQIGFGGSLRYFSDHYANTSLRTSDDRPNLEANAFVWTALTRALNLGVRYSTANYRDAGPTSQLSLSSTFQLSQQANLSLSANRSVQNQEVAHNLFVGLNYRLENGVSANLFQGFRDEEGETTFSLQKSASGAERLGYRLQINTSDQQSIGSGRLLYR